MQNQKKKEGSAKRLVCYVPDYVVFDFETTGISWMSDDIIEISAVKVQQGSVTDTFSTLVNPNRPIPFGATMVNGITDDMVEDAPDIEEALESFLNFIGDEVLVGHNIASFDLKFLYQAAERLSGKTVNNDYIDTLYMARTCLPQLKHHKLTDIASHFQISTAGAHRAFNDCIMNQRCYEELGRIQSGMEILLCPKCGGELKKRSGKFGEFYGCSNFPACRYTKNIR